MLNMDRVWSKKCSDTELKRCGTGEVQDQDQCLITRKVDVSAFYLIGVYRKLELSI